jgi:hypothetical protein
MKKMKAFILSTFDDKIPPDPPLTKGAIVENVTSPEVLMIKGIQPSKSPFPKGGFRGILRSG